MLPQDNPDSPWQEKVADYFQHNGKEYWLISNLFSKYPLLFHILSKSSQSLVQNLNDIVTQYGPPNVLYSNNRPPFMTEGFERFLQRKLIDHITFSLHFHHSYGFIERQVKRCTICTWHKAFHTLKTTLTIAQDAGTSHETLLLELWSTPIALKMPLSQEILHNCTIQ